MTGRRFSVAAAAWLALLICAGLAQPDVVGSQASGPSIGTATFVGADTCASCHQDEHKRWKTGRHSKMVQPASAASVKGDFATGRIVLHGSPYELSLENGEYFIGESYLTGKRQRHRVDFTLGSRRVQHYLTTLKNGQIVVLPPSWDVQRQEWFHNKDIVLPDASAPIVQQWNRGCVGCHVSQQETTYRADADTYETRWVDFGTSCERCHGPGSRHVERYRNADRAAINGDRMIVRPTALPPETSSMICAQCHSARAFAGPGFRAGENYWDYFVLRLEHGSDDGDDRAYWPDGRPRRFSNDAAGLWQSECFVKGGATCTSCHYDPHLPNVDETPQLASGNNALCTTCHEDIGVELTRHTRHRAESPGSSCVECHMPKTVHGVKATIRDHTMSLPAPENTVAFGIPNACTECHKDRDPTWAVETLGRWWPNGGRQKLVARAEAFSAGRSRRPEALNQLLAIAGDEDAGPLTRANAVGYLRYQADPRATAALLAAAMASQPAIRVAAIAGLGERAVQGGPALDRTLFNALGDARRAVRLTALRSIVSRNLLATTREPASQERLRGVTNEFAAWAHMHEDDAEIQHDLGLVQVLMNDFDLAARALENSLRMDPRRTSTRYLLGLARVGQGREDEARTLVQGVPRSDPYYGAAQDLLKSLTSPP